MSRPFALQNAPCVLGPTALKESQLEMEGGRKRRVVEARLLIAISLDDPAILTAMEPLAPLLRQEMSFAMREGDDGGGFEFRAKKKIPAMTILLGGRPKEGKDLTPVFRFTVAECLSAPIFKGSRDGTGSVKFVWKVRIMRDDLGKFAEWLGTDMAITVEQTQVTLAELESRKNDGENIDRLLEPDGKKGAKGAKAKPQQGTFADAIAAKQGEAGLALMQAAVDGTAEDEEEADIVADILGLVAGEIGPGIVDVPADVVKTWTKEDRELARKWGSAVHLKASDNNNARIPELPEVLAHYAAEFAKALALSPKEPEPALEELRAGGFDEPAPTPTPSSSGLTLVTSPEDFGDTGAKDGFDLDDDDGDDAAEDAANDGGDAA